MMYLTMCSTLPQLEMHNVYLYSKGLKNSYKKESNLNVLNPVF